jgi:hypothetical protein
MALLNYVNLFERLNPLVKFFEVLEERQMNTTLGTDDYPLPYQKLQILAPYEEQGETGQIATIEADYASAIAADTSLKATLLAYFEATLRAIGAQLKLANPSDLASTIDALGKAMLIDAQSIQERVVALATADQGETTEIVKPHASNLGNGVLLCIKDLPGGVVSEIAFEEIMQCECIRAQPEGMLAGSEVFQLSGQALIDRTAPGLRGSGLGPTLSSLYGINLLLNGDFENWTSDPVPELIDWTVTGTVAKEASIKYRGSAAVGCAGTETFALKQAVNLAPLSVYIVGVWVRRAGGGVPANNVIIEIQDAAGAQKIAGWQSAVADLSASAYEFKYAVFVTGSEVAPTWRLAIRSDGATGEKVYFDNIQLGELTKHNNLRFAILSGSKDFYTGDKFGYGAADYAGFKIEVTTPGIYQAFLGRCFDKQLPSSGAPTIADPTW